MGTHNLDTTQYGIDFWDLYSIIHLLFLSTTQSGDEMNERQQYLKRKTKTARNLLAGMGVTKKAMDAAPQTALRTIAASVLSERELLADLKAKGQYDAFIASALRAVFTEVEKAVGPRGETVPTRKIAELFREAGKVYKNIQFQMDGIAVTLDCVARRR